MRRLCSSPAKRGHGGAVPRAVPAPYTRHLLALHAGVAAVKAGEVAARTVEVAGPLTVTACTLRPRIAGKAPLVAVTACGTLTLVTAAYARLS